MSKGMKAEEDAAPVGTSSVDEKPLYQSEDIRVRRLVRHLDYLSATADKLSDSRAALAELRQAIKNPTRGAKHVVPYLSQDDRNDEVWFYRVASLFAMHRRHQSGISLGTAFRLVRENRERESIEGRFTQLLSASPEQLFDRLIGAVTLLKADEQPLDWCKVLDDARFWGRPNKSRQHALARDYYRAAAEENDEAASTFEDISAS